MSVGITSLTSGQVALDTFGPTSTASIAPTANRLVLLGLWIVFEHEEQQRPTITGGGMTTWTFVAERLDAGTQAGLFMFRALQASPSSGAISIDWGAPNIHTAHWSVVEFDSIDTSGTNGSGAIVQAVTNVNFTGSASALTVTLAAFGSVNNAAFSAFSFFNLGSTSSTATPDTGWTEVHEQGRASLTGASWNALETQFRATNDTTAAVTWTRTGGLEGIAVEIKASAAAETITVDKWQKQCPDVIRRKWGVVNSGTTGIKA